MTLDRAASAKTPIEKLTIVAAPGLFVIVLAARKSVAADNIQRQHLALENGLKMD